MHIRELLDTWLEDWSECNECNHMCINKLLCSDNEDNLVCKECLKE